jgi:DNA-binding Lrp family transcriptional regulator
MNFNGENWLRFGYAWGEIRDKLDLTVTAAQSRLRKLCASGQVRAIEVERDEEPKLIDASLWERRDVYLGIGLAQRLMSEEGNWFVAVSEGDLRRCLDGQGTKAEPKTKSRYDRDRALKAIKALYPEGHEGIKSKVLVNEINDWLTHEGKRPVSATTALRAAGRRTK